MFDPTLHFADVVTVVVIGWGAYQRVARTLTAIEAFMNDSKADRLALHHRIDVVEELLKQARTVHNVTHAQLVTEERLGK